METQTPIQRIRKFSRWVKIAYIVIIAAYAIFTIKPLIMIWSETGYGVVLNGGFNHKLSSSKEANSNNIPLSNFSNGSKIFYSLGLLLPFLLNCKIFYHIYMLFHCYSKGSIFSVEANREIRLAGTAICWLALVKCLGTQFIINAYAPVLGLPLMHYSVYDIKILILGTVSLLVVGGVVLSFAWVMEAGIDIYEDHELSI